MREGSSVLSGFSYVYALRHTRGPHIRRLGARDRSGRTALRCVAGLVSANNERELKGVHYHAGGGLVAIQVSAKVCTKCAETFPKFEALSEDAALQSVTFAYCVGDTDKESKTLMKDWGVKAVPQFLIYQNGERLAEFRGASGFEEFKTALAGAAV